MVLLNQEGQGYCCGCPTCLQEWIEPRTDVPVIFTRSYHLLWLVVVLREEGLCYLRIPVEACVLEAPLLHEGLEVLCSGRLLHPEHYLLQAGRGGIEAGQALESSGPLESVSHIPVELI